MAVRYVDDGAIILQFVFKTDMKWTAMKWTFPLASYGLVCVVNLELPFHTVIPSQESRAKYELIHRSN